MADCGNMETPAGCFMCIIKGARLGTPFFVSDQILPEITTGNPIAFSDITPQIHLPSCPHYAAGAPHHIIPAPKVFADGPDPARAKKTGTYAG